MATAHWWPCRWVGVGAGAGRWEEGPKVVAARQRGRARALAERRDIFKVHPGFVVLPKNTCP